MAIKIYNSITETGGGIGTEVQSGIKGAIFPKISTQQKQNGGVIHRKVYLETDTAATIDYGINGDGLFSAAVFDSASDIEEVGDLLGTEDKYGSSIVTKLEDSGGLTETVNGAGGLADIKKITVAKDITTDVYFRAGDKISLAGIYYTIDTIADVAGEWELTVVSPSIYFGAIGLTTYSLMAKTLTANEHWAIWIKVTVQAGETTEEDFSTFSIVTVQ